MPELNLTEEQKAKLAAAGIDVLKLLATLGSYAPQIIQLILSIVSALTATASGNPKTKCVCDCQTLFQKALDGSLVAAAAAAEGCHCCCKNEE